jgi:glycosyltransferase involved in cell wall biosynthesis
LKILLITNNFPPDFDGIGDYTFHLANEYKKKGDKVIIATRQSGQGFDNFEIWKIDDWNFLGIKKLLEIIRNEKPDWVSLQYVPYGYSRIGIPLLLIWFSFILKIRKVKLITTFHEVYVRFNFSKLSYIIQGIGQRITTSSIALFSSGIVTSIDRYQKQLARWNLHTQLVPVGSNIIPYTINAEELKQEIAPGKEFIISSFGLRNTDALIKVFYALREENNKVKLLLCGRVNKSLLTKINDKDIIITGEQSSEMIYKYLCASDLFIILDHVSVKGEGGSCSKSGALASAFAAGLPAIGTYGDMTDRLLMNSGAVILSDYNDTKKIVADICSVMNDPEKLMQMKNASEKFFKEELDWTVIVNKYKKLMANS